jgi:hypothetical protein
MRSVQSVWNAVEPTASAWVNSAWNAVQPTWNSLLQSQHHMRLYMAIAAVLVFLILVLWATRDRGPATLSLNQPAWNEKSRSGSPRRRAAFNQSPLEGLSLNQPRPGAITPGWANVTPINRAPAMRCAHCDAALAAKESFCPACGYAQSLLQTGTASNG